MHVKILFRGCSKFDWLKFRFKLVPDPTKYSLIRTNKLLCGKSGQMNHFAGKIGAAQLISYIFLLHYEKYKYDHKAANLENNNYDEGAYVLCH